MVNVCASVQEDNPQAKVKLVDYLSVQTNKPYTMYLTNTVKSRLSERQLSETTGLFEDDGQSLLFSLLSIAIKLPIIRISIIRKNQFFEVIRRSRRKKLLLKLPFKIRSPNVTHDDHDFFVWSSSI